MARPSRTPVLLLALMFLVPLMGMLPLQDGAEALSYPMDTGLSGADASLLGENPFDHAGNSSAIAGDVNGDGLDDLLIGATNNSDGGTRAGKTYLFLGRTTGWETGLSLAGADASFIGEEAEDISGLAVAGAGDVDGDGYDDILISAEFNSENGHRAGQTYLILGKGSGWATGTSLSEADASFLGEETQDVSGLSVDGAGDVNGDGYDDILISAHGNDEGGQAAGQVYLVLGRASGWAMDTDLSDADASFLGERNVSWFGCSVAGAGDVNGDGYDDILIGAYNDDEGGGDSMSHTGAGQTYLILGRASGWEMDTPVTGADASFLGEAEEEYSGVVVDGAGDVDGDGYDDILISSPRNDDAGNDTGKVHLIFGRATGWAMDTPLSASDASFLGEGDLDFAGMDLAGAGDVDGDGHDDILVGAYNNNESAYGAGQTYLVLGREDGWTAGASLSGANASFLGEAALDMSGMSVAGGGDLNGDGYDDIVITSPRNDEGGQNAGKVHIVFPDANSGPLSIDSVRVCRDPGYGQETGTVKVGEDLFIEIAGQDGDPDRRDLAMVDVRTNESYPVGLRLRLLETGESTGVYRSDLTVASRTSGDRRLMAATPGETLNVSPVLEPAMGVDIFVGHDQLNVTDLTAGDTEPWEGETVTLEARVGNPGLRDLVGVEVAFEEWRAGDPGNVSGIGTGLVDVPAGGTVDVAVDWDTTDRAGERRVRAVVDPADLVDEENETDNSLETGVLVVDPDALTLDLERTTVEQGEGLGLTFHNPRGRTETWVQVHYPNGTLAVNRSVLPGPDGAGETVLTVGARYPDGEYTVRVICLGRNASRILTVRGEDPVISSPADVAYVLGDTGNSIRWTCHDPNPSGFNLTRDGSLVDGGAWDGGNVSVVVDGLGVGTHNYTLTLVDRGGNRAQDLVRVTVEPGENRPPVILTVYPEVGATVDNTTVVTGTAMDPDGDRFQVLLRIDDRDWTRVGSGGNWSHDWRTRDTPNGDHVITVRAVDLHGDWTERRVRVRVYNGVMEAVSEVDDPVESVTVPATTVSVITVSVLGLTLAATDMGRWALFKLLFLGAYAKRRDEKVLDNFIRGWVQGVVVRDPGIRPVDVIDTFEGQYSSNLIYYHIHELIKFGYIYMVRRDRRGRITKVRRGRNNRVVESGEVTGEERSTNLTLRRSRLKGMTLHLYPTGVVAPRSQVNIRKKQRFMIYKYISQNPGVNQTGLAEGLDITRQGVAYHLKELQKDGLLIVASRGRSKNYYIDQKKDVGLREAVEPSPRKDRAPGAAWD